MLASRLEGSRLKLAKVESFPHEGSLAMWLGSVYFMSGPTADSTVVDSYQSVQA